MPENREKPALKAAARSTFALCVTARARKKCGNSRVRNGLNLSMVRPHGWNCPKDTPQYSAQAYEICAGGVYCENLGVCPFPLTARSGISSSASRKSGGVHSGIGKISVSHQRLLSSGIVFCSGNSKFATVSQALTAAERYHARSRVLPGFGVRRLGAESCCCSPRE